MQTGLAHACRAKLIPQQRCIPHSALQSLILFAGLARKTKVHSAAGSCLGSCFLLVPGRIVLPVADAQKQLLPGAGFVPYSSDLQAATTHPVRVLKNFCSTGAQTRCTGPAVVAEGEGNVIPVPGLDCCRRDAVPDPPGLRLHPVAKSPGQSLPAAVAAEAVWTQQLAHLAGCPGGGRRRLPSRSVQAARAS